VSTALPDYHTHTSLCGHAEGEPGDYVRAALGKGIPAVGISDHLPLLFAEDPELTMTLGELEHYVQEILELKARHPGFVLLGIEADYRPDTIERVGELVSLYPFDYVIGSVHFIDGWDFDDPRFLSRWDGRDVDKVYREYFGLVAEAAETGVFTILGHVDLVKKFGHRPTHPVEDAVWQMAGRVADAGVIVELNTAGLHKPVGEIYPDAALLSKFCRLGVPITFGSDAHRPQDVGRDFDRAALLALAAGYTEYAALVSGSTGARAQVVARALPALEGTAP
jgi:histidinol-phosphatase (PHP family)